MSFVFSATEGLFQSKQGSFGLYNISYMYIYMGVSLNGGTPKTPQNDHF